MPTPSIQSNSQFTSSSPNVLAYTSNNTAGNTSVVVATTTSNGVTWGISDTQGNSYTQLGTSNGYGGSSSLWVATGIAAGANTVTVTMSPTGQIYLFIDEEPASAGVRASSVVGYGFSTSVNPSTTLTGTVSGDVCVVVGGGTANRPTQSVGSIGTNTAFSLQNIFSQNLMEDGVSSGGTITVNTVGADQAWIIAAVALIPPTVTLPSYEEWAPTPSGVLVPRRKPLIAMDSGFPLDDAVKLIPAETWIDCTTSYYRTR